MKQRGSCTITSDRPPSPSPPGILDRLEQGALARRAAGAGVAGQFGDARCQPPPLDIGHELGEGDRRPGSEVRDAMVTPSLRILLPRVQHGEDIDLLTHAIDHDVVRMGHGFSRAGDAAGSVGHRLVRQAIDDGLNPAVQPIGGGPVSRADIVQYVDQVGRRLVRPDEFERHPGLWVSMIACARAFTASGDSRGAVEAIARATLARNHAS